MQGSPRAANIPSEISQLRDGREQASGKAKSSENDRDDCFGNSHSNFFVYTSFPGKESVEGRAGTGTRRGSVEPGREIHTRICHRLFPPESTFPADPEADF